MLAPNFGLYFTQESVATAPSQIIEFALEAPKTPFLTLEEYAEIAAKDAGINAKKFRALISCESVWREDAAGDHGTSLGILQFKEPTFELFSKKYNLLNHSIDNPYHQIDLAILMIRDGYLIHWKNCARHIGWLR